ncbi:hypothetical protein CHUAL_010951 [Chamberlinius hualienensis]
MPSKTQVFVVLLGLVCTVQPAAVMRSLNWELMMGNCPKLQAADIHLKELEGNWYVQRYTNDGGFAVECAVDSFAIDNNGLSAAVNSTYTLKSNKNVGHIGTNWDELGKGEFMYHLDQFPLFLVKVIAVAYEKDIGVALTTCLLEAENEIHLQVLTRKMNPDKVLIDKLMNAAALAGAKVDMVKSVSHSDCPKVESGNN